MSLVDVKVDSGTLWIGNSAYILKNITSIEPFRVAGETQPPREKPRGKPVLIWMALFMSLGIAGVILAGNGAAWGMALIFADFVIVGVGIFQFRGKLPPLEQWEYFEIRISTAGRVRRVLAVQDWDVARDLTGQIADAITEPDAGFHMRVETLNIETFHQGDNNVTYGDESPIETWG